MLRGEVELETIERYMEISREEQSDRNEMSLFGRATLEAQARAREKMLIEVSVRTHVTRESGNPIAPSD